MARKLTHSYLVSGTLKTRSPLHVGSGHQHHSTAMPLSVNGNDQYYIPGSSVAGALKAWARQHLTSDIVELFWGTEAQTSASSTEKKAGTKTKQDNDTDHFASYLWVDDAIIQHAHVGVEVLHGVAIDRQWGTARPLHKFDRQVLPRGTDLNMALRVDVPQQDHLPDSIYHVTNEMVQTAFSQLIKALIAGDITFGGGRSSGLGQVVLLKDEQLKIHTRDWQNLDGVVNTLKHLVTANPLKPRASSKTFIDEKKKNSKPSKTNQPELPLWFQNAPAAQPKNLHIEIQWQPISPVMSKAPFDGLKVDTLPLFSALSPNQLALLLPGSGIKGVLRSQAERIVRTLLASTNDQEGIDKKHKNNINDDIDSEDFMAQLDVPLVKELFGLGKPKKSATKNTATSAMAAAMQVHNCYSLDTLTRDRWQNMVAGTNNVNGVQALDPTPNRKTSTTKPQLEEVYRIAIDRWTGGAADNMLFTHYEPHNIQWEPIRLTLAPSRLNHPTAAFCLIWLLLRDLTQQRITLGYGNQHGFGQLSVSAIKITGTNNLGLPLPSTLSEISLIEWSPRKAEDTPNHETQWDVRFNGQTAKPDLTQAFINTLEPAWHAWIDDEMKAEINTVMNTGGAA